MDERAVLQGLQSWNSYIWSQTVDICMYRNSTIISRSQRLGYKRTGPSGLAELEQLHVESNSAQLHIVSEPDPSCGGGGKGLGTILHSSCPQVGMLT